MNLVEHLQACSSRINSFQIVPYSDLLLGNPENMAAKLRQFHETNDPERWVIVDAILDIVNAEDGWIGHWDAFFESEMYRVCIDILQDDATYVPDLPQVCSSAFSFPLCPY